VTKRTNKPQKPSGLDINQNLEKLSSALYGLKKKKLEITGSLRVKKEATKFRILITNIKNILKILKYNGLTN